MSEFQRIAFRAIDGPVTAENYFRSVSFKTWRATSA